MELEFKNTKQEQPEADTLNAPYLDVYREANLRYPQSGVGITALVAAALLRDPKCDFEKFARSQWDEEQLATISRDMDRAHAARGVGVQSEKSLRENTPDDVAAYPRHDPMLVSDDKLHHLWNATKQSTLFSIASVSGVTTTSRRFDVSPDDLARDIKDAFRDSGVRDRTRAIFESFDKTLRGEKASVIAREIRRLATSDNRAMHKQYRFLFDLMTDEYNRTAASKVGRRERKLLSSELEGES